MADIVLGFSPSSPGVMPFAGQFVLRLVLPGWGFFALIFAVFAYLHYAVAVALTTAAFGFAIGFGLVAALGIDWNWPGGLSRAEGIRRHQTLSSPARSCLLHQSAHFVGTLAVRQDHELGEDGPVRCHRQGLVDLGSALTNGSNPRSSVIPRG